MLSKDYKNVLIDQDENGITTVTFNRPDKKNALNPDLHNEMLNIMNELEFDDSTRVVILTGAGDSFCAGQDLKEFFLDNVANPKDRIRTSGISRSWGKIFAAENRLRRIEALGLLQEVARESAFRPSATSYISFPNIARPITSFCISNVPCPKNPARTHLYRR